MQPEQLVERFRTVNSAGVQLTDNDRRCKLIDPNKWHCVFGTQNYSSGIHRIRLKLEEGTTNILMGICSQNKPPTDANSYCQPTVHGWFIHGYTIKNGKGSYPGWPQVNKNDVLELTLDCNGQTLSILNERSRAQNSMQVNADEAPFPWCLLILFYHAGSRVSLV